MGNNRVKFYGKEDRSNIFFVPRIKEIMDNFLSNQMTLNTIEEAIEIQNIIKYIDAEIFSDWTPEYIERIKDAKKELKRTVAKYLGTVKVEEILDFMKTLIYEYRDDFFETFAKFKYADKISEELFMKEFRESGIPIRFLLKSQYLITVYSDSIKSCILANPLSIEMLISNFTEKNREMILFPNNISKENWDKLLDEYIDDPNANINYMAILENPIKNLDSKIYFSVTPKQKIRIKKRYNEFSKSIMSKDSGLIINTVIYSNCDAYTDAVQKQKNQVTIREALDQSIVNNMLATNSGVLPKQIEYTMVSLVDKDQIDDDHSFESLLKYFSMDFDFFTEKLISNLPSYPNKEIGTISKNIGIKTVNSYEHGFYFNVKNEFAVIKIHAISTILNSWDLDIEDLINWFFTEYCAKQYDVRWLPLNFPHKDEIIGNRTSTLFRIEESIRKQYQILVTEDEIKSDLVNETPTPLISNLQSLHSTKYAILSESNLAKHLLYLIFNDQSQLNYINEEIMEDTFFDLILKHKLKISDFKEYHKEGLQCLIDNNIITEKNNILHFKNSVKTNLLHEIYIYGSISYINSSSEEKIVLKELEKEKLIVFSNTLFTKQETDYLNFLLNNKVYDNSWGIRNKYQHGVPHYDQENQYRNDYVYALLILLMYMVKINNELKHLQDTY